MIDLDRYFVAVYGRDGTLDIHKMTDPEASEIRIYKTGKSWFYRGGSFTVGSAIRVPERNEGFEGPAFVGIHHNEEHERRLEKLKQEFRQGTLTR